MVFILVYRSTAENNEAAEEHDRIGSKETATALSGFWEADAPCHVVQK